MTSLGNLSGSLFGLFVLPHWLHLQGGGRKPLVVLGIFTDNTGFFQYLLAPIGQHRSESGQQKGTLDFIKADQQPVLAFETTLFHPGVCRIWSLEE